jgi:two-component system KDP operon response regulator KdpE
VREIRAQTQTPIIVLSTLADEATKVGSFKLGVDDYVIKPGSSAELLARMEAVLRRCQSSPERAADSVMSLGKLEVNLERQEALRDGIRQHFSQTEWRLLRTLVKYIGQIVDHQTLLALVWGPDYRDETQYLHVYMRKLRRKLEFDPSHPRFLMTEWGVGYRLVNGRQTMPA